MVQLRFAHLYLVVAVVAACCYSGEVRWLIFSDFDFNVNYFVAPLDGSKRTSSLLGLLTPAQLHHYNWQLQPGEI